MLKDIKIDGHSAFDILSDIVRRLCEAETEVVPQVKFTSNETLYNYQLKTIKEEIYGKQ
jgi:hypothetical protein